MNIALDNTSFARLFSRPDAVRRTPVLDRAGDRQRRLAKGALFAVRHPLGNEVVCLEGTLWITHSGDVKDLVLERGQRYVAERSAEMMIQALDDSVLRLR